MVAGNAGPDLFAGFETKQLPHYAGAGAALNMDPYMARSTTIKPASFFAYTWSKHVINGHLSAMPTNNAMLALFYNVDLFKEAGVAPPPKQWGAKGWDTAAFLDTAHKLTKNQRRQAAVVQQLEHLVGLCAALGVGERRPPLRRHHQ